MSANIDIMVEIPIYSALWWHVPFTMDGLKIIHEEVFIKAVGSRQMILKED